MNQGEAWLITLLGIVVVFIGLILCIAFINFFNRLSRNITWDGAHSTTETAPVAAAPVDVERAATPAHVAEPIPPDVLAVIATTLEIERRLYQGRPGQRLTIVR